MFAKRLPEVASNQRDRSWRRLVGVELQAKTLAIIGLGTIGSAVARLGLAFGMNVIATRRDVTRRSPEGVTVHPADRIDEVLAAADFVVLTVPRTQETDGLMNASRLGAMKGTALLINVGRGRLIDEIALAEALANRRLGAAALDVFQSEPLEPSSPLWAVPNLFVSPHMSAAVEGPSTAEIAGFIENFDRFVTGKPLMRVVDKLRGY
jgi:phosphoglycerate dehydrogenase-like enzyme